MSKFTPGPWHVGGGDRSTIYDKSQQRVANSFEGVLAVQRSDAECRSNACLIASAPDLLSVVQGLYGMLEDNGLLCECGEASCRTTRARAVIAKATGETA